LDAQASFEHAMHGHVFPKLPKYILGLKPGLLWVRCPNCGRPHREYFGPDDRDERNAELTFLRHELQVASGIIASRPAPARPARQSRSHHRNR